MPVRGTIRVICVVAAVGGSFAACSSDTFGTALDASSMSDGGVEAQADAGSIIEAGPDACAGDCQGGACIAGICQPITLATGLNGPYGVVLRGSSIYVTEYVAHGRVLRFDKNGGPGQSPFVVATEASMAAAVADPAYRSQPFSVGVNDVAIVWTDVGDQPTTGWAKIFNAPVAVDGGPDGGGDGGPLEAYYLCGKGEIVMDTVHSYWANQANNGTYPCGGPEVQNGIFRGEANGGGHSGSFYFPIDGGPSGNTVTTPLAVGLNGDHVFVGAGKQLLIFQASKINDVNGVTDTDALLGGSALLSSAPYAIGSNFDTVVWTDYQPNGSVYALPRSAGLNTAPTLLASGQGAPLGIAFDDSGDYVHYTTFATGMVMRVRKDGVGGPHVVLSGLDHPAFLASDATTLYFTIFASGAGDGKLLRVAKPL